MLDYIAFYSSQVGDSKVLRNKLLSKSLSVKHSHIFNVTLNKPDERSSVPYYNVKLGYFNVDTVKYNARNLIIDTSSSNNKEMTKFKKFMNSNLTNPSIKLNIQATQYWYEGFNNENLVGYSIKAERKDVVTAEPIGKPIYFYFWNSRTSLLFQKITLCEFMEHTQLLSYQVKYPKQWTNKKWLETADDGEISLNQNPIECILALQNINSNYPLSLKQALCEYLIEDLYYYILFSTNKTPRKILNAKENPKMLVLITCYHILTSYKYEDKFSYALFKSRTFNANIKNKCILYNLRMLDIVEENRDHKESTAATEIADDLKNDLLLYYILIHTREPKLLKQVYKYITKDIKNYSKLINSVAMLEKDIEILGIVLRYLKIIKYDETSFQPWANMKNNVSDAIEELFLYYKPKKRGEPCL